MFCQPTDENSPKHTAPTLTNLPPRNNYKARRKNKKKQGFKNKKNNSKLAFTMSTWAENFTVAATWQLKHQIAYWKARAKALEYENSVLHDVIRRNQDVINLTGTTQNEQKEVTMTSTSTESINYESEEDDFVVSEQYIQFLADNAKFKEEARLERERLKAKQEEEENATNAVEEPRESVEESRDRLKQLYGDMWQRISALETNMASQFINDCDKNKPIYWPNIPFNFNYS